VCARWGERSAGIASHVARAIAFASWTFSTVDDSKFRPMKAQQACNSTSEERANKTSKKKQFHCCPSVTLLRKLQDEL
jgi:hypothetical protein